MRAGFAATVGRTGRPAADRTRTGCLGTCITPWFGARPRPAAVRDAPGGAGVFVPVRRPGGWPGYPCRPRLDA
ncbi:hypothetical protein C3492_09870 [Streptomyces sp. Ru62]|nr:hypothetical protein C3492_09870 [Streptomyces sp. Ru62]